MPESPSLFRKAALDQLSSPEQLDLVMRVTSPRAWLALVALAAVVVAAVVWSVVGAIPTQVTGQGILIRTGGVSQVVSTSAGRLTGLAVKAGDQVRQGDVVARVAQGDLSDQVQTARADLTAAESQRQSLVRFQSADAAQQAALFRSQRDEATQTIAEAGERARWFADRVKVEEQLLQQGLWTESQLIATRQDGRSQIARQENARTRLNEITVAELAWKNRAGQEQATLDLRIGELQRALATLERRLASASAVISSYDGRVVEVTGEEGQLVSAGSPVLILEPFDGTLEALLYLPAADGKKVAPGMSVRLAPATVKPEEYGYIIGTVRSVSHFPATTPGMMRVLHNEGLVTSLSATGAPFELYATLVVDPATPSGYHWTSGTGPEAGLFSGTLAAGLVTVRTQRPIELVIPYIRSWLGLSRPRRVVTPTVIQMEAVECGAASLAIVLGYHGRIVPLEELRVACGVSRDGGKASNILKAARSYGMTADGWRKDIAELRSLQGPVIVFWTFSHFLVVEGFGRGVVYLNDPASGRRTVTDAEFDRSYTGVVLELQPSETFTRGGQSRSIVAALAPRLAGSTAALVYAVLIGLILVIPGLVIPTFTRLFVDSFLITRMDSVVRPLLVAMVLTMIVRALAVWLQQHYLLRLETKLALTTSSRFLWHLLRMPMAFFTQRSSGDLGSRVAANDRVATLLSGQLATTALSLIASVCFLAVLFAYDTVLATVAAVVAGLNFLALRAVARQRVDGNQKLLVDRGKLVGTTMYGVQSIETLKGSGSESDFFTRWAGYQAKVVTGAGKLGVPTLLVSAVPPFLTAMNTLAILWLGGLRVMDGAISIGMLMAFQALSASFIQPVTQLVGLGATLQEAQGDMNRLDDVLNYRIDPQLEPRPAEAAEGADDVVKLSGAIELRNVTFGYSRLEPPLIKDFSLTVAPGERVALVGGTGSGKSTISRLVTGLYEPWSGEVLFDGRPRRDIPRRVLNDSLGLVDQDVFLFDGTLRDNLSMWDATLPDARIVQAARDACIHDDIAARPSAYDGRVEEGGRNFSGGQRQRLEIARALVGDPTMVVLDEATSALDAQTEKDVDDSLRRRGCSCLIVAHRLSTIRDCDEIVVLERGVVVQRGSHEQMKNVDGPYARLIAS